MSFVGWDRTRRHSTRASDFLEQRAEETSSEPCLLLLEPVESSVFIDRQALAHWSDVGVHN